MQIRPILSAMSRNKFGALLIAVQMSVTLAILVNSISLIEQRLAHSVRPTGVDEADLFVVSTEPVGHSPDVAARERADLAALRSLEGVDDAYVTNDYPLAGGGWSMDVNLTPDQKVGSATTAYYFADEHGLATLGLKLIAGRNFAADEIVMRSDTDVGPINSVIVTKTLADKLFPGGDALGKSVYIESETQSVRIVGIVDRLQTPFTGSIAGAASTFAENSTIAPFLPVGDYANYMVKAKPGQRDRVLKSAERMLREMDGERIISSKTLSEARVDAYRADRGLVVLLSAVCIALLAITAFGIVGLTSYWVSQRRRQIGIRRALGATRRAILEYFQTENLLIAAAGALTGIALAIGLNLWMVHSFEAVRMDNGEAIVGALIMVILGQAAVLYPALRAASIPPALATRGG